MSIAMLAERLFILDVMRHSLEPVAGVMNRKQYMMEVKR